mgnify:CR=1 FL=1
MEDNIEFTTKLSASFGSITQSQPTTIKLTCKSCGATMIVEKDRSIITCPYCHSAEMIQEGDEVKVQRIKSATMRDMQKAKYDREREIEDKKERKEHEENFLNKSPVAIVDCALSIWCVGVVLSGIANGHFLWSLLGLIMTVGTYGSYKYAKKEYMEQDKSYSQKKSVYFAIAIIALLIWLKLVANVGL